MTMPSPHALTDLLVAWNAGDPDALEKLTPFVYDELHRLAQRYMAGERGHHTLQATALVNEAYARLIDWKKVRWQNANGGAVIEMAKNDELLTSLNNKEDNFTERKPSGAKR